MNRLKKIKEKLLKIMFVKRCVGCGQLLAYDYDGYMCDTCYEKWEDEKTEVCPNCMEEHVKCECRFYNSRVDSVRHLAPYSSQDEENVANMLVYALKRSNDSDIFDFVANEMADNLVNKKKLENTVCVGVPRGPRNIKKYGYDHAKKLAKRLAEVLEIGYADVLFHKGGKTEQKKLDHVEQRRENARKNCSIKKKTIDNIRGKNILLVDDIGTTGSMATACAELLKEHGALRVDCILCTRNEGKS